MRQCRHCGSALSRRSQKVYCDNACQAEARRDSGVKRCLETGEAAVDSRRTHYIRQYLSDAQNGCCAICGGANTWLGEHLALILDHVDGHPTNNRRLVCPNCDSQLATYKSRNRGNGRHLRRRRYADGLSY